MSRLDSIGPNIHVIIAGSIKPRNTIKASKPSVAFHQSSGNKVSLKKCLIFITQILYPFN